MNQQLRANLSHFGVLLLERNRLQPLFLLVVLIAWLGVANSPAWTEISYAVAGHSTTDIFFLNNQRGWATVCDGSSCFVLSSENGGKSWGITARLPRYSYGIFFLDSREGWCLRSDAHGRDKTSTFLLATQDGGHSWRVVSRIQDSLLSSYYTISQVGFANPKQGWIIGEQSLGKSLVLTTQDGGHTWERVASLSNRVGISATMHVDGQGHILIAGGNSIVRSLDYGNTWEEAKRPSELSHIAGITAFESVSSQSDGRLWITGQDTHHDTEGFAGYSLDVGKTWHTSLRSKEIMSFGGISFSDSDVGCAIGSSIYLACTLDGGNNWFESPVLPEAKGRQSPSFRQIILLPSQRGWVIRDGGFTYETVDGGHTWREVDLLKEASAQ